MKTVKLNGAGFNAEAVAKFASASLFYLHPSHQHYWNSISSEERYKRLTIVYNECIKQAYGDFT